MMHPLPSIGGPRRDVFHPRTKVFSFIRRQKSGKFHVTRLGPGLLLGVGNRCHGHALFVLKVGRLSIRLYRTPQRATTAAVNVKNSRMHAATKTSQQGVFGVTRDSPARRFHFTDSLNSHPRVPDWRDHLRSCCAPGTYSASLRYVSSRPYRQSVTTAMMNKMKPMTPMNTPTPAPGRPAATTPNAIAANRR